MSEITNEGSLELEKAILQFLGKNMKRQQSYGPQRIAVKVPK